MKINVHAGHNPDGKTACGAVGIVKESTEARAITAKLIEKLRAAGHTVYDCTVDNGTGQLDVLKKIVAKCNEHTVDLDASIHLNSGRNDYVGDGSTGGTEVFCHGLDSKAVPYAQEVAREISALGFRLRDDSVKDDIKTSSTLYVLKNTKAPAMLIESFFVDDKDDVALYQKVGGADGIAEAIVKGILKAAEAKQVATSQPQTEVSAAPAPEKIITGVVTGDGVNVRKGPGTSYGVIGSVNKGQSVRIWKEENGWTMIDNDKWISSQYVQTGEASAPAASAPAATPEPAKEIMGTIVGHGVRVRKGPGTTYDVIGTVNDGQSVRVWTESRGWYMIDTDKWVFAQYVRVN